MSLLKPPRWAVSRALISPEWQWAWNGLRHLWLFDEADGGYLHDHVGGYGSHFTAYPGHTTWWEPGPTGIGLLNQANNPQIVTDDVPPYATDQLSVLAVFDNINDLTNSGDSVIGQQTNVSSAFAWILRGDLGTLDWRTINDSGDGQDNNITSYLANPFSGPHVVMGTFYKGHNEVVADGVFRGEVDHSSAADLRQPTIEYGVGLLGSGESTTRGYWGRGYLFAIWHKTFSRTDAERITADPFGFVTPDRTHWNIPWTPGFEKYVENFVGTDSDPWPQSTDNPYDDNFYGSSGAWASPWVLSSVNSGTDPDLNANRGRFQVAAVAGSCSRAIYNIQHGPDVEYLFNYQAATVDSHHYWHAFARASGDWYNDFTPTDGYMLQKHNVGATCQLIRLDSGAETALADITFPAPATTKIWVRWRLEGNRIKVRAWADGDDEPATWGADVYDATHKLKYFQTSDYRPTTGGPHVGYFNDFLAWDLGTTAARWNVSNDGAGATDPDINTNRGRHQLTAARQSSRGMFNRPVGPNFDMLYSFEFDDNSLLMSSNVMFRGSGVWEPDGTNASFRQTSGYLLQKLNTNNQFELIRFENGSETGLDSFTSGSPGTDKWWVRVRAMGDNIKVKVWQGTEPTDWDSDVDDGVHKGTALSFLQLTHTSSTGTKTMYHDDIEVISYTPGSSQKSEPKVGSRIWVP